MKPAKYDLDLYRGDTYDWRFTIWDDEAKTIPTNLTGATPLAHWRDSAAALVVLVTAIVAPNHIDMHMTTALWTGAPKSGGWDLQITFPDGSVRTAVAGAVAVTDDWTHA